LGEAVIVGAAREVEEECGLTASSLRWHPTPITATDAIFFGEEDDSIEFHYLIAQCFAWHTPSPVEEAEAGDDAMEVQWFTKKELAKWAASEGLWYSRNILEVVDTADRMVDAGLIAPVPN